MTDTPPRPSTPVAQRPLTPNSPAAPEGSPGQRAMGTFFPEDKQDGMDRVQECPVCQRPFSLVRFKHRCKACDRNVCNDCSKSRLRLDNMGVEYRDNKRGYIRKDRGNKSSRVCDPCARSYFESKLETECLPTPIASIQEESQPFCQLPVHPTSSRRSLHNSSLLRRRHLAFFLVFAFLILLRLVLPIFKRQSASLPADARQFWNIGQDAAISAIYRMTRLDVFGVGLLVLVALDEWLFFKRARKGKHSPHTPTAACTAETTANYCEESTEAPIKVDVELDDNDLVSLDKLSQILADSVAEGSDLGILSYLTTSSETAKLLVCFGKATSFAGSTVSGYIDSIETNLNTNPAFAPNGILWRESKPTLHTIVEKEIELGIATSGGKKHPSICRSVLRLIWFLDFVETILRVLNESTTDEIGQGVSKAYESTLGTRHPWLIRKGVMTALSSCPSKSSILAQMVSKQSDILAHLQEIQQQMKLVIESARTILSEKELLDIK